MGAERLATLLTDWNLLLQGWSADGRLSAAAQEALLLDEEPALLTVLIEQWSEGDFSGLPPIVLLTSADISRAIGAYAISTGTIYLNADWLATASQDHLNAVLTEELGHHLDALLNISDTFSDEGQLFSSILFQANTDKAKANNEADSGYIFIGDALVAAEFAGTPQQPTILDAPAYGRSTFLTTFYYGTASNDGPPRGTVAQSIGLGTTDSKSTFISKMNVFDDRVPTECINYDLLTSRFDAWAWMYSGDDNVTLTRNNDFVALSGGNDSFTVRNDSQTPWGGIDYVYGGSGIDRAFLPGSKSEYSFDYVQTTANDPFSSFASTYLYVKVTRLGASGALYTNQVEEFFFYGEQALYTLSGLFSSGTDTTPPTVTALSVNGSTLTLTLSETLSSVVPLNSRFSVLVDGVSRTVNSAAVNTSNNTVTLTLASAVTAGQTVTLAYSDATTANDTSGVIQDVAGNDLASFSAVSVSNNTFGNVNYGQATFSITGTRAVGQLLTAAVATADPDGNGSGGFTYIWQSSTDGTTWGNIGTNSSTYTIAAADEGKQLQLVVSYTDGQAFPESVTTAAGSIPFMNSWESPIVISKNDIVVNLSSQLDLNHQTNRVALLAGEKGLGSAWWNQSVDLSKNWRTTFTVSAFNGSGTSDGFTFSINGDQLGTGAIGDGGQNLGFFGFDTKQGLQNSYAVMFDMWVTNPTSLIGFSPSTSSFIPQGTTALPISLSNNQYAVSISYSSSQSKLSVEIGGGVFEQSINLADTIGTIGYLGFTAANGGGSMDTDISDWSISASTTVPSFINKGQASFSITGTHAVGQTLTATVATPDPDGNGSFSHTWQASANGTSWTDIGTGPSLTIAQAQEGQQLRLLSAYTDGQGFAESVTTAAGTVPFLPVLAIAATSALKAEGNSTTTPFTFTVTRTGDLSVASSAQWAVTGAGTNPASAADFQAAALPSGTVTFAAGDGATKTITVNVAGDTFVEANETFAVLLSNPSGASLDLGVCCR